MTASGTAHTRIEARDKVIGAARYTAEYPVDHVAYAAVVQATIAKGQIRAIDTSQALAQPGVLSVLTYQNTPRLHPVTDQRPELAIMQSSEVAYRGQIIACVVADSQEIAREATRLVQVDYAVQPHSVVLREDDPNLYKPDHINPNFPTDTQFGDFENAFAAAPVKIDHTYRTPAFHNNPMEMHAATAIWDGDRLTLYDSNQGSTAVRDTLAEALGLERERVRVISRHVGGAFGQKGTLRPHTLVAALAARAARRPVKLAITRQQMFAFVGYRTPTIQRIRLAADADGRLTAIGHDVVEQTSTIREFAEQTAVATRVMYAAPNRRTSHRVTQLDVPTPSWMRAPGECPGMYALESAMDEMAIACGQDPIEFRMRNEPDVHPEDGLPFSSRHLVACLREGVDRFGWRNRDPRPGVRVEGRWMVGTGVAASTYPAYRAPASATARLDRAGIYTVLVNATDIGTGARTTMTQIAADALKVSMEQVHVDIGDSDLPPAPIAGGSSGTASWGTAVFKACRELRSELERRDLVVPQEGLQITVDTTDEIRSQASFSRHAFGAQFAEVRIDRDTGEIRVPRLLGVFAAGHIINPTTARSQLVGGMTMGLSMALHEKSVMDRRFGDYVNHDLATYHIAAHADVRDIQAYWIDEDDPHLNPMGTKGIGEIGIVGTAAAIANGVYHATAIRVRELPIHVEDVLG
jgi:xanthine dehydrogenase YagR molybdenum-binding subunit